MNMKRVFVQLAGSESQTVDLHIQPGAAAAVPAHIGNGADTADGYL